jgi:hypothetical protein
VAPAFARISHAVFVLIGVFCSCCIDKLSNTMHVVGKLFVWLSDIVLHFVLCLIFCSYKASLSPMIFHSSLLSSYKLKLSVTHYLQINTSNTLNIRLPCTQRKYQELLSANTPQHSCQKLLLAPHDTMPHTHLVYV